VAVDPIKIVVAGARVADLAKLPSCSGSAALRRAAFALDDSPYTILDWLNGQGQSGWELVAVIQEDLEGKQKQLYTFIFKRAAF
jgi:hypothetical protein